MNPADEISMQKQSSKTISQFSSARLIHHPVKTWGTEEEIHELDKQKYISPGLLWLLTGSLLRHHRRGKEPQSREAELTFLITAEPLMPLPVIVGALLFQGEKVKPPWIISPRKRFTYTRGNKCPVCIARIYQFQGKCLNSLYIISITISSLMNILNSQSQTTSPHNNIQELFRWVHECVPI